MSRYAEVAVFPHRVPLTKRIPETYTYLVPDDWPELQPGAFVLAPFGTQSDLDRLVSGIVMRVTDADARFSPLEAAGRAAGCATGHQPRCIWNWPAGWPRPTSNR